MRTVGNLSSRVALYRRDAAATGGRSNVAWALLGLYAAEVRKQSDRTFAAAEGQYVQTLVFVTMRTPLTFRPGPLMRLDYLGDQYEVLETVPDTPQKGFTRLRCQLVKMGGEGIAKP